MLEVLEKLGPRQNNHMMTGDKCCIYWDNQQSAQWTINRAAVSPRIDSTISPKKIIVSGYFIRQGLFRSKNFWK
jgi:hypothetical protein